MTIPLFLFAQNEERMTDVEKNKKRRKDVFTLTGTAIGILIACVVFVPQEHRKYALFLVAAMGMAAVYFHVHEKKQKTLEKRMMQIVDIEPDYKQLFVQQTMLRINEKLHWKFPAADIEICDADILRMARTQQTICVAVKKAENFSHLNISLLPNGVIKMNLFSLVNFEAIGTIKAEKSLPEDDDVEHWYRNEGQRLLTELVTNMNSRGFSKLSIRENGDVLVEESGENVVKDYFPEIPPKKQWAKLKKLMSSSDIQVQTSGKLLTFTW